MHDFTKFRDIKSTRASHKCSGCTRAIFPGSPAFYFAGLFDGYFGYGYYHTDCRAAEVGLNDLKDYRNGDDWILLSDLDSEDREWLADEYPTVYARMFPALVVAGGEV